MTETLLFAYDATAPDLDQFDVKTVHPANILGTPGAFVVVGSSHYVGLPELGYHEVCSCKALGSHDGLGSGDDLGSTERADSGDDSGYRDGLPEENVHSVSLEPGVERTFAPRLDGLRVETLAEVRDLAAFPGPEAADVAHRFAPEAWTTIAVGEAGYETYHTYPEYDLALYTRTRLDRDADADFARDGGDDHDSRTHSNP